MITILKYTRMVRINSPKSTHSPKSSMRLQNIDTIEHFFIIIILLFFFSMLKMIYFITKTILYGIKRKG